MIKWKNYFLPVIWMITIFVLSSFPGSVLPRFFFPGLDKIVHVVLYGVLAFLWYRSLRIKALYRLIIVCLIGFVYGLIDEIHQLYVPLRYFDAYDLLADCIGTILGGFACLGADK